MLQCLLAKTSTSCVCSNLTHSIPSALPLGHFHTHMLHQDIYRAKRTHSIIIERRKMPNRKTKESQLESGTKYRFATFALVIVCSPPPLPPHTFVLISFLKRSCTLSQVLATTSSLNLASVCVIRALPSSSASTYTMPKLLLF